MNTDQIILFLTFSAAVAMLVYWLFGVFNKGDESKLRSRLRDSIASDVGRRSTPVAFKPMLSKIGQAASKPFMPADQQRQSQLKKDLARAGVYTPSAIRVVAGARGILLAVGLLGGYVTGMFLGMPVLLTSVFGLMGYMAPTMWLKIKIKSNQKALEYGLADALDLMVVCVEAGLTVDAALQRVGEELAIVHPAVARELSIAHMETRVGVSRSDSLKNLGLRTGSASVQSLAAMLVQADRFGTSIASALRIHAESIRLNRTFKAEEMAAKSAVKMSFPLVLFIFPATFIVLVGPTVIELMNSPLMN